jgi:hypothetical protein
MFHVSFQNPSKEFGTSGLVRDGNGNPLVFGTQEEAVGFISANGYEDAKVVTVDHPVDLHNPGGMPQVGSAGNPATPGKQVHPVSVALSEVKEVQAVNVKQPGEDESMHKDQLADDKARAKFEGAHAGTVIETERKLDADAKKEDQAKVAAKVDEHAPNAPKK